MVAPRRGAYNAAMICTDTHCHLSMVAERQGQDALGEVLARYDRAQAAPAQTAPAGPKAPLMLDIGVEAGDLESRAEAFGAWPFVRLSAGVYPSPEALSDPAASLAALGLSIAALLERGSGRVAAIGETGLDYHHMSGSHESQAELFTGQARLAESLGLPLVVHSRDAARETLEILVALALRVPVIIHCFGYGKDEARAFLDAGCYISFAGNLSYKKAEALREACAIVPAERLLLETDAPYMNPEPHRGRSSTSLDIERTYALAAALRGERAEELAERVAASAAALFG